MRHQHTKTHYTYRRRILHSEQDKEVYMSELIEKSIVDKSKKLMALRKAMEPSKAQQWMQNKFKSLSK